MNNTPTTTSVSSSPTSLTAGTIVTFSANVAASSGVPFGGATFYDGTLLLGTHSLQANGSCSYSTAALAVGTHNITAMYNANSTFAGSASSVVVVTVTSAASALAPTVVSLATTDGADQSFLAARVTGPSGVPTGEVTFLDDGNILGSAATNGSGSASLAVPALKIGSHNLSASFAGTSRFAPSVSPELLEQFPATGAGFSLSVPTNSIDLTPAGSQPILLTVVPAAGFQQQVLLSCADGVPHGYECDFSPTLLAGGNSYLRIEASPQAATKRTQSVWPFGPTIGICSVLLFGVAKRRRIHLLLLLVACLDFMIMAGCGNPPTSPGQAQIMVLSIRATAGTGGCTIVQSAQILVDIQPEQ